MLTGISGSYTVAIASTIAGFNAAVLSASAANSVGVDSGTGGMAFGIMGKGFISFRRGGRLAFQRGLERVPRQARALHPHGKLPHAGKHRQLAEILDWLVGRSRHDVMKTLE